ncbi:MAG: gamma carbonic anhydrase family protein [Rhodospirillales bacterium]|nr:gamma carbonic anhydrase family protein [Rhodospirillales bacterium]
MTENIISFRGHTPEISNSAFIAPTASIIGDVKIGAGSGIWYNCVLRGDMNEIRIGENSNVQDGTIIHVASLGQGTYIGSRVSIGHLALIHACTIEDGAMIGMQATVMDGALIEAGALVAAGSLVPPGKRVLKGQMWAGTPAKYIRDVRQSDQGMIDYIWPVYRDLAAEYIDSGLDTGKPK